MKSTYKLIWSDEALEGLKNIFVYLEYKFSEKDVKKFAQKFDKQLELIRTNPEVFPLSPNSRTVRRSIIAKLTSIYYVIDDEAVKLITITDNRKNPKNLNTK
jgi:plasmid stabilization system protein ParE